MHQFKVHQHSMNNQDPKSYKFSTQIHTFEAPSTPVFKDQMFFVSQQIKILELNAEMTKANDSKMQANSTTAKITS